MDTAHCSEQIVERLRAASRIAILTGAGLSAESGIPTFRDAMSGLWSKYAPSQLATPQAFARDPALVSRWYDERRAAAALCEPNAGHAALARLQRWALSAGKEFTLITQNVDGLHQRAGSANVLELHGSLRVWRCLACGTEVKPPAAPFSSYPPICACGGRLRPGIVWFGEALPPDAITRAEAAAEACDFFASLGTSAVVYPAAGLISKALTGRAAVMEINPEPTDFSAAATWSLREKTGEMLPVLVELVERA